MHELKSLGNCVSGIPLQNLPLQKSVTSSCLLQHHMAT